MVLKARTIYVIIKALEARKEYIQDNDDAPQDELPEIESALETFRDLYLKVEIKTSKGSSVVPDEDYVGKCNMCGKYWVEIDPLSGECEDCQKEYAEEQEE